MGELGEYEIGSALHFSPRTAVYRARKSGSAAEDRSVIKVYQNPFLEEGAEADPLLDAFLESAQFHREVQAKLPEVCLPCQSAGKAEGKAWVVTPYERFTLERIFEGKVAVDAFIIHQYLLELLTHLARIKEVTGRGHGNLKPSNIFLTGDGTLPELKLQLADFAPSGESKEGRAIERADLVGVGRILYQLVTRQESRAAAVADKGEWAALFGKAGPLWLAFCEDLLKAGSEHSVTTLDSALEQLEQLKPKKQKPWGLVGAITVVLVFAGILTAHIMIPGGLLSFFQPPPPVTEETRQQWETLVHEYNAWGESVHESLQDAVEMETGTQWHLDPYLFNQVLGFYRTNIEAPEVEMDPWEVVDRRVPWQTLNETVPEILGREKYVIRTEQTLQFIQFLKVRLESWPTLERMDAVSSQYRERGWEMPAEELRGMLQEYAVDEETPQRIERILEGVRQFTQIERTWESLSETSEPLIAEGSRTVGEANRQDPLLVQLPELYMELGGEAESLQVLNERVEAISAEVQSIRGVIQSPDYRENTDIGLFRDASFLAEWDGSATMDVFRRWQEEIPQYRILEPGNIPLRPTEWEAGYAEADTLLEKLLDLDELVRRTGETSPLTPERFQEYQRDLSGLRELGTEARNLPRVVKYRPEMAALNNRILEGLEALRVRLRDMMFQLRPDPDEWLKDVNSRTIAGSPVLDALWAERRAEMLEATPRSLWENDDQVFSQLRADLEEMRSFLADLASESVVPGATIEPGGIPDVLFPVVQERVVRERESALASMASLMPEDPDELRASEFIEREAVAGIRQSYVVFKQESAELARIFEAADSALNRGEGLDALPGTYFTRWEAHPVYEELQSIERISNFTERMRTLRELSEQTEPEPESLLSRVNAPDAFLALRLQAYRKLDDVPAWPDTEEAFQRDADTLDTLLERVEGTVRNQLQNMAELRWKTRMAEADTPAAMNAVFAHMERYFIDADSLEPENRYAYFLYTTIRELSGISDLRYLEGVAVEERKQVVLRNLSRVDGLEAFSPAESLANELIAFDPTKEQPPPPPTELGPALAGWNFLAGDSTQDRYVYSIDDAIFGEQRLEFHRLENPDGGSFWVSDIEVSTAIFRMVIDIEGSWPAWEDYNRDRDLAVSVDDRTGPRTWEYVGGLMEDPPDGWLFPAPGWDSIGQIYATEALESRPTGNHPVNYVPAPLAEQFAEFLSCRLPTPRVWEMLLETFPNRSPDDDNIRDAAWLAQLEYVEETFNSFHPWPDADAFSRSLIPEAGTENDAEPVDTDYNDGTLWFEEVRKNTAAAGAEPLHHLYGNMAEYLYDGRQYSIAGRSAISPPQVAVDSVIPVPELYELTGFSDVGFRLMFVIDRMSPGIELIRRIEERYATAVRSPQRQTAALNPSP